MNVASGTGSGRKVFTWSSSCRSAGMPSNAETSASSDASMPLAWSCGLSAFHRSQTLWLKPSPGASASPSTARTAASWISAPLPMCERTSATVHSEAPDGPVSWSAESPGTRAARVSCSLRRAAIVRPARVVMTRSLRRAAVTY